MRVDCSLEFVEVLSLFRNLYRQCWYKAFMQRHCKFVLLDLSSQCKLGELAVVKIYGRFEVYSQQQICGWCQEGLLAFCNC